MMKIIISLSLLTLLFACKGNTQSPPVTVNEIDSVCNALEADFKKSVTKWKGSSVIDKDVNIPTGYYKDTVPVPMYFNKTENNVTLLRIGEGTFEMVAAVSPYSGKFSQPELKENIFYFWNDKLIKATRCYSFTDYNFDPARYYAIHIAALCNYFVDDKLTGTRYFWDDSLIEGKVDWGGFISDIDLVAKAYAMLKEYKQQ